jgi:hypothetical protein
MEIFAFELPCRQAAAGMPHDEDVPDYEPLSRDQVAALLGQAASAQGDWRGGHQAAMPAGPGPARHYLPGAG